MPGASRETCGASVTGPRYPDETFEALYARATRLLDRSAEGGRVIETGAEDVPQAVATGRLPGWERVERKRETTSRL